MSSPGDPRTFDPWGHMHREAAVADRHRENSSRLAQAHTTCTSTGWGEHAYEDAFVFGTRFIQMPWVAYSFSIDDTGPDFVDTRFPKGNGFIYKWQIDSKGFYTGAYMAITVEDQGSFITVTADSPNYVLLHHFSFFGIAMKSVPDYLLQA